MIPDRIANSAVDGLHQSWMLLRKDRIFQIDRLRWHVGAKKETQFINFIEGILKNSRTFLFPLAHSSISCVEAENYITTKC